MTTTKFTKDGISYLKKVYPNGSIVVCPDLDFQIHIPIPDKPPLPNLSTDSEKLDFIINYLGLKDHFSS